MRIRNGPRLFAQRFEQLAAKTQDLGDVVVRDKVELKVLLRRFLAADVRAVFNQPAAVVDAQAAGHAQMLQNAQMGKELLGLLLAAGEALEIARLTAVLQEQLLAGKNGHLAGDVLRPALKRQRVGMDVVPVKELLQEGNQLPVEADDGGADLPAVVVGEDERVDQHAHAKADGAVPDAPEGVGDGLDVGRCAQEDDHEDRHRGRKAEAQRVVEDDAQRDADAGVCQHRRGQMTQQEPGDRAEDHADDLLQAGGKRFLERRLHGGRRAEHREDQAGVRHADGVDDEHGNDDRDDGFERAHADQRADEGKFHETGLRRLIWE